MSAKPSVCLFHAHVRNPFLAFLVSCADNLEVLSLGRNQIKKLEGLDDVANTLRELWISYNLLDKLNGLEKV